MKIGKKQERAINRCREKYKKDGNFEETVNSLLYLLSDIDENSRYDAVFYSVWIMEHPNFRP